MTEHDPLCPKSDHEQAHQLLCECDLIADVRADERDKVGEMGIRAARAGAAIAVVEWKAGFRAQVEALGHTNICSIQLHNPKNRRCTCFQKEVLALIDGGTDG